MELKEAIQISLTYLGDEDATVNNKTAQHPRLKLLVKCANLVIKEIATDYIPLTETETVSVEDNRISYEKLLHRVLEVLSVKDAKTGIASNFKMNPTECVLANTISEAEIKYSYIPVDTEIDEQCPVSPLVSARTLALGICAEYSLIEGMYEQSVMYSDRFKEDMRTAVRKKGEIKVKPRRWV